MAIAILKPGRERSLKRRHPWVFSGAIANMKGNPSSGETIEIHGIDGEFLGYGAFSPDSQIRIRVWSWNQKLVIDDLFFRSRLQAANEFRKHLIDSKVLSGMNIHGFTEEQQNPDFAFRLVHAESDGLPGLVVDQYGDTLVIQILSAGPENWRDVIADTLLDITTVRHIFERSDAVVRKLEGLADRIGPVHGSPPESLNITENGVRFNVNIRSGQKTGFFLDQRQNRKYIRDLVKARDVLDCFTYTGGFTINSLVAGAKSITAIDSSDEALEIARENVALNGFPDNSVTWVLGDVFQELRRFRDRRNQFDMIILDPPKFAPTASQVKKAARGYKDINLLAFKLLRPGGILVTFSCSGGVSPALFQKIVADAAVDAGINGKIIGRLEQSPDHPVSLSFPEGAYLKGLIIQVEK